MRSEGRPNLYTDEQLLNVLKDYQKSHPNQKIKYVQLEKATGIKVHIWKYQMRDTIEAINKKIEGQIFLQELVTICRVWKICS